MKFAYKELPDTGQEYLRPVLPIVVEGRDLFPHYCLLDTGALHNRFGAWVAKDAGVDLTDAEERIIALGGFTTSAREAIVRLSLDDYAWEAPVWFCDPWPLNFQLLGQEGFFKWFDVRLRTAVYEIEITPEV